MRESEMRQAIFKWITVLFLSLWASIPASAENLIDQMSIMTEDYPPFNYEQNGILAGVSTDIMAELLERADSQLSVKDIQLLPWARGYKLALSRPYHAIFSTTRTESREALFKWVGPFVPTVIGVIAKKERTFDIGSKKDLFALRIGAVKDDIGHLLLQEMGMPQERMEPVLLNSQNYKKLVAGRIDAIAYETSVSLHQMAEMVDQVTDYEVIYELQRSALYLALNPDTPDGVVTLLQKHLDAMKADGTYAAILQKYQMSNMQ